MVSARRCGQPTWAEVAHSETSLILVQFLHQRTFVITTIPVRNLEVDPQKVVAAAQRESHNHLEFNRLPGTEAE